MIATAKRANVLTITGNIFLFIFKLFIGVFTNSIAVISDAINSLVDTVTSILVYFCMKISRKSPDENHPFGHFMAEPLGAMLIAVLTCVMGVEILYKGFLRLFDPSQLNIPLFIILIYPVTIVVKGFLYYYTKYASSMTKSQALKALYIDHRNDALVSLSIIIGFFAIKSGYYFIDSLIGFFIAGYIIKSGLDIGLQNIKYIMGETPSQDLIDIIREKACSVRNVKGVNLVKAHYIGLVLNVEVHINVDKNKSLKQGHDIGDRVQKALQSLDDVERAFVHVEPV